MSPGSKPMDNCKEFSVMDIIISFCLIERAGYTSDGLKSSSIVLLREDGSRSKLGRIYFEEKEVFIVWSL